MDIKQLNQMSEEDLAELEGLDEESAKKIVDYRNENGDFKSWEDLENVPGVTKEVIEMLKNEGSEDEPDENGGQVGVE